MDKYNTLIGFDFGLRFIGVAVGQSFTRTASPLTTISARDGTPQWSDIDKIIKTWEPDAIVVGIPLNMDGTEQPITAAAKHFIQLLEERYHLPVLGMDERLSTKEAKDALFQAKGYKGLTRKAVNEVAAQLILESWFNSQG